MMEWPHSYRCPRDESPEFPCMCDLIHDVTNDVRKEVLTDMKNEVEDYLAAPAGECDEWTDGWNAARKAFVEVIEVDL
jgi:hypothetical protein